MTAQFDKLFGALADDHWFPSPAHVMRRAAILDMFTHFPSGRLLEMGCGAGRLLVDWDKLGHAGLAVDLDPTARALAERCATAFDIDFAIADRTSEDGAFDYLVATEVLEHVQDPGRLLRKWNEHLKVGGIFLGTVPAFQALWAESDEWAGHVQRFEPDAFRRLVEDAGLEVLDMRLYGYPLGNLLRLAGNMTSQMKMRARAESDLDQHTATLASGHDRSVETSLAPLMRSWVGRTTLHAAIALQRRYPVRGHGLVLIARKPAIPTEQGEQRCPPS